MKMKFEWERISIGTLRAKVYGGWIINTVENSEDGQSMVFVPDLNHEWSVE